MLRIGQKQVLIIGSVLLCSLFLSRTVFSTGGPDVTPSDLPLRNPDGSLNLTTLYVNSFFLNGSDLGVLPVSFLIENPSGSNVRAWFGMNSSLYVQNADFATVLNSVVTAAKAIGGGVIYVKDGDYAVASAVTISGASNLLLALSPDARLYRSAAFSYHLLLLNLCQHVSVVGGVLDGVSDDTVETMNGAAGYLSDSLRIQNCTDIRVQGVYFVNASDDAIYLTNSSTVKVLDNTVDRFYKHAIDVSDESASFHSSDIIISRNTVDGKWHGAYDGITVDAYTPQSIVISENTVKNVINSTFTGLGYWESGIHVEDRSATTSDNDSIIISSNAVRDCQRGITSASTCTVSISHNTVWNTTYTGVYLENCDGNSVDGNTIEVSNLRAIQVDGGHNSLVNNVIRNSLENAIYCYGVEPTYREPQILIMGNTIEHTLQDGLFAAQFARMSIIGNTFIDSGLGANNTYADVYLAAVVSRMSDHNIVLGNWFRSNTTTLTLYQLYLGNYVTYTNVAVNNFDSGGSAGKVYNSSATNQFGLNIGYP